MLPHSTGRPDYPLPPNLLRTSGSSCAASPGDQHRSPTPKLFLILLPPKLLLLPRNKLSALTLTLHGKPCLVCRMTRHPTHALSNSTLYRSPTCQLLRPMSMASCPELKSGKAPGIDHITPDLHRYCANGIVCSLACLFNRSFELSQFPQAWKEALVLPVYKKGCVTDPGNYRPIALLPIVSKVLERIVHNKLSSFLSPWLSKKQSGFRKADGTVPQLVRLTQQWSEGIDRSHYIGALFFDLKKAFDKVCYRGLIAKLNAAGIRGSALKWFESFLENRNHVTVVNGRVSSPAKIHAGVPQGAILSPLLFSIYVNDITRASASVCDINLFADDTLAFVSSPTASALQAKLQLTADVISCWFSEWHLTVNTTKTVSMVIRSQNMPPCTLSIRINDKPVEQRDTHRHLGVTFSSTLRWAEHINSIIYNASRKLGVLRRLRRTLTPAVLLDIYTTCIRPTLEYANLVWCGLSKSDCARLERCQRSAARIITGISPLADVSRDFLLARAGLCTLETRRNASLAFFVKRLLTDRLPQHLRNVTNAPGCHRLQICAVPCDERVSFSHFQSRRRNA